MKIDTTINYPVIKKERASSNAKNVQLSISPSALSSYLILPPLSPLRSNILHAIPNPIYIGLSPLNKQNVHSSIR